MSDPDPHDSADTQNPKDPNGPDEPKEPLRSPVRPPEGPPLRTLDYIQGKQSFSVLSVVAGILTGIGSIGLGIYLTWYFQVIILIFVPLFVLLLAALLISATTGKSSYFWGVVLAPMIAVVLAIMLAPTCGGWPR